MDGSCVTADRPLTVQVTSALDAISQGATGQRSDCQWGAGGPLALLCADLTIRTLVTSMKRGVI